MTREPIVQLVCCPIGNLADITYRAVKVLETADIVACEDTRHSRQLLNHYQISPGELIALHEHNEQKRAVELIERISSSGEALAFLSDAGSPSISDPGYRLVQAAIDAGVKVEVIPGPSAVSTALVGSGLPPDQFTFIGFLPVKSGRREKELQQAIDREGTTIAFESPHRILKTLAVLQDIAPEHQLCVARELTKKFETYHRGTAAELLSELGEGTVKGEITIVIGGTTRKMRREKKQH